MFAGPMILCVGDDLSDEEMFQAVHDMVFGAAAATAASASGGASTASTVIELPPTPHRASLPGEPTLAAAVAQAQAQAAISTSDSQTPGSAISNSSSSGPSSAGLSDSSGKSLAKPPTFTFSGHPSLVSSRKGVLKDQAAAARSVFTCCVGMRATKARYFLHDANDVLDTLQALVHASQDDKSRFEETLRHQSGATPLMVPGVSDGAHGHSLQHHHSDAVASLPITGIHLPNVFLPPAQSSTGTSPRTQE